MLSLKGLYLMMHFHVAITILKLSRHILTLPTNTTLLLCNIFNSIFHALTVAMKAITDFGLAPSPYPYLSLLQALLSASIIPPIHTQSPAPKWKYFTALLLFFLWYIRTVLHILLAASLTSIVEFPLSLNPHLTLFLASSGNFIHGVAQSLKTQFTLLLLSPTNFLKELVLFLDSHFQITHPSPPPTERERRREERREWFASFVNSQDISSGSSPAHVLPSSRTELRPRPGGWCGAPPFDSPASRRTSVFSSSSRRTSYASTQGGDSGAGDSASEKLYLLIAGMKQRQKEGSRVDDAAQPTNCTTDTSMLNYEEEIKNIANLTRKKEDSNAQKLRQKNDAIRSLKAKQAELRERLRNAAADPELASRFAELEADYDGLREELRKVNSEKEDVEARCRDYISAADRVIVELEDEIKEERRGKVEALVELEIVIAEGKELLRDYDDLRQKIEEAEKKNNKIFLFVCLIFCLYLVALVVEHQPRFLGGRWIAWFWTFV